MREDRAGTVVNRKVSPSGLSPRIYIEEWDQAMRNLEKGDTNWDQIGKNWDQIGKHWDRTGKDKDLIDKGFRPLQNSLSEDSLYSQESYYEYDLNNLYQV